MLYCSIEILRAAGEIFWGFRTLFERFPKGNQRFEGINAQNFRLRRVIP